MNEKHILKYTENIDTISRQEWTYRSTILEESPPNTILRAFVEKRTTKVKRKNTYIGHLTPYNPLFRIFSEKLSGSKDGPYCLSSTLMQKKEDPQSRFQEKTKRVH